MCQELFWWLYKKHRRFQCPSYYPKQFFGKFSLHTIRGNGMDLMEISDKRKTEREEAAQFFYKLADSLTRLNGVDVTQL